MPQGKLLWEPDEKRIRTANITGYAGWLEREDRHFEDYDGLWRWSVDNLEEFWQSIWDYFRISSEGSYRRVLSSRRMPGAKWFEGARLNFAEHVFREKRKGPALIARSEDGELRTTDWSEMERMTGSVAESLGEMGVKAGDRVAGYLPNSIEAAVAFLACASIGAVWSGCSPDFGPPSVADRFGQIAPKVLFAAEGYRYGGKAHDRAEALDTILSALPSVKKLVVVRKGPGPRRKGETSWEDVSSRRAALKFRRSPAAHPLWILYSSGTTGLPKPLVHSTVGILLEHMKILSLHNDLKAGDRLFWFTTTGWMMWNYLLGGLLHGAACVLYDGSPSYPDSNALWDVAEETGVSFMGASAAFISSCMKAKVAPAQTHRLSKLRGIGSTGSPLNAEAFEWVYAQAKEDVWLASISGGTDLCTPFVGGCPTLPVFSGEIQCRCLGAKVESFDESGKALVGKTGELVVTEPMPSMPVQMWGDKDGSRYRESYFGMFPGVWRHGDWVEITERGTCVIHGRSDATIKRMGIRIGTSELYRSVESMPEVADVLAVDLEGREGKPAMFLFVATSPGATFSEELSSRIRQKISDDLSRRHVPDFVVHVRSVPRTLNGKRMEVPVKRIFEGGEVDRTLNRGSMADPASADEYVELARRYRRDGKL